MIRTIAKLIFVIYSLNLYSQDLPMYTVDLDNEMHYKINATNWQERGVEEFKEDMLVLFKKNDFISNKSRINVFFEIEFNEFGNPKLSLLGTSDTYEEDILQRQIKNKITKLVNNFKPARYEGKIIAHKYLVHFNVRLKNNLLSIANVGFESTISFNNDSLDCFTIYSKATGNVSPDPIFLYTNIAPEYNGGIQFLCFNLNKKIKNNFDKQISRRLIKRDSVEIPFIISKEGKLGMPETYQPTSVIAYEILNLMKTTACEWKPAIHEGRKLYYGLRMKFVYEYIIDKQTQGKKLIKIAKIEDLRAFKSDFKGLND